MNYVEHPFAQYIRIIGKGKNGARPLTQDEAFEAFKLILSDQVHPEQLGAFLMLMRAKEETAEEVAGFVRAVKSVIDVPQDAPKVDLDWSSYAGKRRHLPWFILSTLALAESGLRVFMHGAAGHTNDRIYTKDVLSKLGIKACLSLQESAEALSNTRFAYLDLSELCPKLQQIIELRPLLGLRSPVHTIARMINPFNADYVMQGIFHPGYRPVHQEAALLLQQPHVAVIKGDGGEIERNPDMDCLVQSVHLNELSEQTWPPLFKRRHVKDQELDANRLAAFWRGEIEDEYAYGAITGTMAIALHLLGKANDQAAAQQLAEQIWHARSKEKYGVAA